MKIIYMGTPDFAVPALDALAEAGHDIVAVYSQPPRPAGRGKKLHPTPVHARAEAMGLPVRTPLSLKGAEEQAEFAGWGADIAVVAAYGLLLPQAVLDAPARGCLNIHASLLPRWRGAAPIQRAVLAGDDATGITIMRMEAGLDTGPMLATVKTPIADKTAGALTEELAKTGAVLIARVLDALPAFTPVPQPQDGVTYARKIDKAEARIAFAAGAVHAQRQVRAFNPTPGAFFTLAGERFKILEAVIEGAHGAPGAILDDGLLIGCGADSLRPVRVQRAGKGAMTVAELLRGFPVPPGTMLDPMPEADTPAA